VTPRLHVEDVALAGGATVALPESAAHHALRVLRLRDGDAVTLFDGSGGEWRGSIVAKGRSGALVRVLAHDPVERESPLAVTLALSTLATDAMDYAVRKAVELGVAAIVPVVASRSQGGAAREKRVDHWRRIAVAACEQCGRNRIPQVHPVMGAMEYRAPQEAAKLLLSPNSRLRFAQAVKTGETFALAAGPEAGFTAEEEAALASAGFVPVSLGPRVLRTETAAVAAIAALNALRGDSA